MGKYALLIGVSNYQNQDAVRPSPSARNDVNALREVLLHPEIGGFDEAPLVFDPDRMELEERIEEFFRKCSANDLAVMYFSGRGLRDDLGRAYFATRSTRRNADGQLVKATALPVGLVRDLSGSSRSRQQVMILDCGFNAQVDPAIAARANGSFSIGHQLGAQGRAILLAADDAPVVLDDCDPDLSLYTHHLVEGMTTGAADQDHDGKVSVKELHTYTSDRVRLVLPTMQPELIALRDEDGAIALTRVFHQNPRQRYREAVQRQLGPDGRLTPASVAILKRRRSQFGLSDADALSVEAEVMQPFREHAERLQDYRQTLSAELAQTYPLSPAQLARLKELQQVLELSDEEVEPIHEALMQPYAEREAAYRTHLIQYEQALTKALLQADPPSEAVRDRLKQQQSLWGLTDADVAAIEGRVQQQIQERRERDRHNLLRYEQEYEAALRASETLGPADRLKLDKLQHALDLRQVQIDLVERRVQARLQQERDEQEARRQQYRAAFLQAIAQEPTLRKSKRDRLQTLQTRLQLSDAEVETLEQDALHQFRQQQHQRNLKRYEQAVAQRLRLECPLNESSLSELNLIQESLMLTDEEIAAIQRKLTALAEAQRRAQAEEQPQASTAATPPAPPAVGHAASPPPSQPLPPPTGQPAPPQSFVPQPGLPQPGSVVPKALNLGAKPETNWGAIAPLPPPSAPDPTQRPSIEPVAPSASLPTQPAIAPTPSPLLPDPWETSPEDLSTDTALAAADNGAVPGAEVDGPATPPLPAEFTDTTASDPPPPPPGPEAPSSDLPEPQLHIEAFVSEGLGQPPPDPDAPLPPAATPPEVPPNSTAADPATAPTPPESAPKEDWLADLSTTTPPPPPDLVNGIEGSVDTPAPPPDYPEDEPEDLGELPSPEGWSAGVPPGVAPPGEPVNGDRPPTEAPFAEAP
ncbi:MAG: caspase family protein, partial [Cyanobacteriota bacterium]